MERARRKHEDITVGPMRTNAMCHLPHARHGCGTLGAGTQKGFTPKEVQSDKMPYGHEALGMDFRLGKHLRTKREGENCEGLTPVA